MSVLLKALKPPTFWTIPFDTSYTFMPQISLADSSLNGDITFSVKKEDQVIGETTITVTEGVASSPSLVIDAEPDEKLLLEFSTQEPELEAALLDQNVGVLALPILFPTGLEPVVYPVSTDLHSAISKTVISDPYRGWNVFGYNGNRDRALAPIKITNTPSIRRLPKA